VTSSSVSHGRWGRSSRIWRGILHKFGYFFNKSMYSLRAIKCSFNKSSYFSSSVRGGTLGGQNWVTFGAVPPNCYGNYDLWTSSKSFGGSVRLQKTYLAWVTGSTNFIKKLAALSWIHVRFVIIDLTFTSAQFDPSSFATCLNMPSGNLVNG
jgi:hypothetical protein